MQHSHISLSTSIDTSIQFFQYKSVRNLFDSISTSVVSSGLTVTTIIHSRRSTSIIEDNSETGADPAIGEPGEGGRRPPALALARPPNWI